MDVTLLSISYFTHLVVTVLWIGGIAFFVFWVYPSTGKLLTDTATSQQLIFYLQKRFRPIANLSLILLLGTGMIQMSADPNYEGLLAFVNTWSIAMLFKHIAYAAMVGLALYIQFSFVPELERAHLLAVKGNPDPLAHLLKREVRFTRIMGILGIVVLVFTAIATAI